MASPASAGKPEKVFAYEGFDENVCGIDVHTTVDGWSIFHIQRVVIESTGPDTDDFWIGVIQDHYTVTWTNIAGETLTLTMRQTIQEDDFVENGDGTWTYTYSVSGPALSVRANNRIVLRDVGRISFEVVFFLGSLSTIDDNEFVSSVITSVSGPHPFAEADYNIFCETFVQYLG
jgi:hypothetical protein